MFDWPGLQERLKASRQRRGLTQSVLAVRAEVGPRTVSDYENAVPQQPDHAIVAKLAKALDVDFRWLLLGDSVVERDADAPHPVVEQVLRDERASAEAAARIKAIPLRAWGGVPDAGSVAAFLALIEQRIRKEQAGEVKAPPPVPENRQRVSKRPR